MYLIKFMEEIREGHHYQHDIPVYFGYGNLNQEIPKAVINVEYKFAEFLSYLYCVYRKIEIKMEKFRCPNIFADSHSQETSFMKICLNLDKAKEDYASIDDNDFVKAYPILKRLFLCYTDYIRYSMEHLTDMDDGGYLPGTIEEIKTWFCKLNTWSPKKDKCGGNQLSLLFCCKASWVQKYYKH